MRRFRPLLLVIAAAAVLAGCGPASDAPEVLGAGVAATVDGVEVPRAQLEAGVRDYLGPVEQLSPEERAAQVAALQRQILGFQIQGAVFERVAEEQGVEVGDDDLAAARNRLLEATGTEQQLEQLLAQEGLTPTLFEELILPQEVRIAELAEIVGSDQINAFLVDEIRGADIRVAPGLGVWSVDELRVLPASRVGTGAPVQPGLG